MNEDLSSVFLSFIWNTFASKQRNVKCAIIVSVYVICNCMLVRLDLVKMISDIKHNYMYIHSSVTYRKRLTPSVYVVLERKRVKNDQQHFAFYIKEPEKLY